MLLQVQRQVVGASKGAFTELAGVRPNPRVLPYVPAQLVRPGELPAAVLPQADVGLLPGVGPEVGLEVGALGVDFVTAREVTMVCSPLFQLGVVSPSDKNQLISSFKSSLSTCCT